MIRKSLLAIVLICGCLPPDGGRPGPSPDPDWTPYPADAAIEEMFSEYRSGLKRVFESAARKVERGELDTETAVNEYILEHSTTARLDAFQQFNERMADRIGNDRWTPRGAAEFLREQGDAL